MCVQLISAMHKLVFLAMTLNTLTIAIKCACINYCSLSLSSFLRNKLQFSIDFLITAIDIQWK